MTSPRKGQEPDILLYSKPLGFKTKLTTYFASLLQCGQFHTKRSSGLAKVKTEIPINLNFAV